MEIPRNKLRLTPQQARIKIEKYCSYQERSQWQVRRKLMDYGLNAADTDSMLVELVSDNFLNEERFTRAYVFGKFKTKGWGKKKIQQGLKVLGVNDGLIQRILKELPDADYVNRLESIAEKKWKLVKGETLYEKQMKLQRFLLGKGYSLDAVMEVSKKLGQ